MRGLASLRLDPDRKTPLYRQLAEHVIAEVRRGAIPVGFRLPPTREMAGHLATHRNTVVRAYEELAAAGYLVARVGRGSFIADPEGARRAVDPPVRAPLPWESLFAERLDAEPLRRVERLGREPAPAGAVDLASLSPSEDLLPHEPIRRCVDHVLRHEGPLALGYGSGEGLPRLRAAIARELEQGGVPARAEEVVITTGSQQALDLLARALVDPGDPILAEATTYSGAIQLFALSGARLVGVPGDEEGPDLAALRALARGEPKAFYLIPNCRNPTGESITTRRREALVRWSREAGVPLIEDDYDADLDLDGQPLPPSLRALDREVVHLGTFSKKLMPALRVGYLLAPEPLRSRIARLKRFQDLGTSLLLQHALAEFLERGYLRAHLKRAVPEYRARRDALVAALCAQLPPELAFRRPERGLCVWVALPKGLSALDVFEEARRRGVLVTPSLANRVSDGAPDGLRLSFCNESPRRLAEGAERLGEAVRAVHARFRADRAERGPRVGAI